MKSNRSIDVNNATINNLGTPINSTDAATKGYIDAAIATGGGGSGDGTGVNLVDYSQVEQLAGYPLEFRTSSSKIDDATVTGLKFVTAPDIATIKQLLAVENVDNLRDIDKPISNPTQAALNLKANTNSPTFTGTVSGITKTMVGLDQVNNTADIAKPVSTATQTALDQKADFVVGLTMTVIKPGGSSWPAVRPTNNDNMVVLLVGQAPGPSWMGPNDVLLDLAIINNDIYLMASDILLPSNTLLIKG